MLAKFDSLARGRVARPEMNANILVQAHSDDRRPQIFLDVVGEGAQRRNVNTADTGWQLAGLDLTKKGIENTKKTG